MNDYTWPFPENTLKILALDNAMIKIQRDKFVVLRY